MSNLGSYVIGPTNCQKSKELIFPDLIDCGTNDKFVRIVSSSEVGLWPWMGSIGHYDSDKKWVHKCGATLITSRHGLTAAHCALDSK